MNRDDSPRMASSNKGMMYFLRFFCNSLATKPRWPGLGAGVCGGLVVAGSARMEKFFRMQSRVKAIPEHNGIRRPF